MDDGLADFKGAVRGDPVRELALFAGAGGGILGGLLLGWRCVCAVERDGYAAAVLAARQNDGCLAPFPIWDDVCTFDGRPWRGHVDVISGGFPCQDISSAGKGAGISGVKSGLWRHFRRIIRQVRPRYAWVENSPLLTVRGLDVVCGDLAEMGYDAEWGVLGTADAAWLGGAPEVDHERLGHQLEAGGQLNPDWIEWFMGWPIGWTALEPLAMGSLDLWFRSLGGFCESGWANEAFRGHLMPWTMEARD